MPQLAAIMFTDVAGYTAVVEQDIDRGVLLARKHESAVRNCVERGSGICKEIRGDGSLCLFDSAIDAVRTAIAIQAELQNGPVVPTRIAIHAGEVHLDGERVFGRVVNLASRIESIGQPGSILISEHVFESVRNVAGIELHFLDQLEFKYVDAPLKIYAVANPGLHIPNKDDVTGKLKLLERRDIITFQEWNDQELVERFASAKVICTQVVASYSLFNNHERMLRQFLKEGGTYQCIMIHPESDALCVAIERHYGPGQHRTFITNQVQLAFFKLQSFPPGLELRLTHHFPEPIMTFIDPEEKEGVLFITTTGFRMDKQERPSFVLRRKTHRQWFEFYYNSFQKLWGSHETQAVDFKLNWEQNLIQTKSIKNIPG